MTTVAAEIKALVSAVRTGARIAKGVDSSEALQRKFDESVWRLQQEMAQFCFAICKAFVANALGCDPTHDQVAEFVTKATDDPAFPHRAHRLLGEARKAASQRRRGFLAAMLFGLPFSKLADDDRDRVDMVVERIMPPDVALLHRIADKERTARPHAEEGKGYFFRWSKLVAFVHGIEVRMASTDDAADGEFDEETYTDPRFRVDHPAFASLLSLGCIELADAKASQGEWQIHSLMITPLGRLVIESIEEVRVGIQAGAAAPAGAKEPDGNQPAPAAAPDGDVLDT